MMKVVTATQEFAKALGQGNKMRKAIAKFDMTQAIYKWKEELDKRRTK